jgi:HK97 family phage prohead protease
MERIRKTCNLELKELDDKGGVVGFYYAAWTKDMNRDIIEPGAYKKTLQENKNKVYHNRDHADPVGVPTEFNQDEKGAYVYSKLALKTIAGNDMYEQYKAGLVTGHSQEFFTIKSYEDDRRRARVITEIKLWGVTSMTGIPANLDTPTIEIKSAESLLERMRAINSFLKSNNASDRLNEEFVAEYKQLSEFMETHRAAMPPLLNAGFVEKLKL